MARTNDNLGRRRNPGYNYDYADRVQVTVDTWDHLDDEIYSLRNQVHQMQQVAQHIDTETRYQNESLNHLEETVAKDQAVLNTRTPRLNRVLPQRGINLLYLAIGFALLCSFYIVPLVYLYTRLFRRH